MGIVIEVFPCIVCRAALVEAAMEEMSEAHAECRLEVQRMLQLHNDYLANEDAPDICYLCREEGMDPISQCMTTSSSSFTTNVGLADGLASQVTKQCLSLPHCMCQNCTETRTHCIC
jgi:hypothetical protein